ncbi:MAG: hypothetical protein KatS3mg077_0426 [Candidatus Binatia bacterium]|nr:MAG: hypothetical protein KatS3mg077_0426 [Candidatus Binatia bacterium]
MHKGRSSIFGRVTQALLVALALGVVCVLVAVWFARGLAAERLRAALLEQGHKLTGRPCEIASLRVRASATIALHGAKCGDLLTVESAQARIAWWRSLRSGRLHLLVAAKGLVADAVRFQPVENGRESSGEPTKSPWWFATLLSRITVGLRGDELRLRFPYGHGEATWAVGTVEAEAQFAARQTSLLQWRVALRDTVWQRASGMLELRYLSAAGFWSETEGVRVRAAQLVGPETRVSAWVRNDGSLRVAGDLDARVVRLFADDVPDIHGPLRAVGSLYGSLLDPEVDLVLRLQGGAWEKISQATLRTRFRRRGALLRFAPVELVHPWVRVAGEVELHLNRPATLSLEARGRSSGVANVLAWVGIHVPAGAMGKTWLRAKINGPLEPLALRWSAVGTTEVRLPWIPNARGFAALWEGAGEISESSGEATGELRWLDGLVASVNGKWRPHHREVVAQLDVADLRRLMPAFGDLGARLGLSGSASVQGRWLESGEGARIEANVQATDITVWQSTVRNFHCSAALWPGREWRVDSCTATDFGGGTVALRGAGGWRFDASQSLQIAFRDFAAEFLAGMASVATGSVLPVSRGRLTGDLTFSGTWTEPEVQTILSLDQFRVFREPITRLASQWNYRRGRWELETALVRRDGREKAWLRAKGQGMTLTEATLSSDPVQLGGIVGLGRQNVRGTLSVRGQWSGPFTAPSGSLSVSVEDLTVGGLALGLARVHVQFAPGAWVVTGGALADRLEWSGRVEPRDRYRFELRASLATLETEPLRGRVRLRLGGTAELAGHLAGSALERLNVQLGELAILREPYRLEATAPVRLLFDGQMFRLEPFELQSGESRVRIDGRAWPSGALQLAIRGSSDLVLLELFGPPVLEASGSLRIDVTVERNQSGQWIVTGPIVVQDGTLEIEGIPPATRLRAEARLENSEVQALKVEGEIGGGSLRITGVADIQRGPLLRWSLTDVSGAWTEDLEARVRATGALGGSWDKLKISGDIEVLGATYDRNLALTDLLRWLQERLFAPRRVQQTIRTPVELDLKIYSPGDVFIDNNLAKIELWLDLWVSGELGRPLVGGRIGVLDGEVVAQGRTFTVTSGTIEFRDPASLNPWLNIVAETRVSTPQAEYLITAQVSGQADRPRVQFTADDPALSLDDIVSLIATGRTRASAGQGIGSFPAGAALALVPKRQAEQRVEYWLGVDRFEVSAVQARETGAVEPRVTVGKELGERLYASASTSVGTQSRQTMQLEYRWSRRVSLLGTWESATREASGVFAGDVKFRMEFVRAPFSLLCP